MGMELEQWNGEWEWIECEAGPFPIWWRPHVIHPIPWGGMDKGATPVPPQAPWTGSVIRTAPNVLLQENRLRGEYKSREVPHHDHQLSPRIGAESSS